MNLSSDVDKCDGTISTFVQDMLETGWFEHEIQMSTNTCI